MESDFSEDQLAEIKKIFQHFNKSKSGKLSTRELGILMRTFAQSPTEAELQEIIKEIGDSENDGIDYQEFVSLLSKSMKQEYSNQDYAEVFKVYDVNGDGFITSDDFRSVMASLGETLTKEEAEELVVEADSDGNGQIDIQEFISQLRG